MRYLLPLALFAAPALAQTPLSFDEFEAIVTGSTYTWATPSRAPYGVETYHPDRRVLWTVFGEDCEEGTYAPGPGDQVCFFYPGTGIEQCWVFSLRNGTLRGVTAEGTPVNLRQSDLTAPCIEEFLGS